MNELFIDQGQVLIELNTCAYKCYSVKLMRRSITQDIYWLFCVDHSKIVLNLVFVQSEELLKNI